MTSKQFKASGFAGKFKAANPVLNQEGSWVPTKNDQDQWLQIDLHRQVSVSGVVLQGRPDIKEWITRYQVEYALDGNSWENVTDEYAKIEVCDLSRTYLFVNFIN